MAPENSSSDLLESAVRMLMPVFEAADALWDRGMAATHPGEMACRAGCFGCCVGLFEISLPEALLVLSGFQSLPETERSDITARAERIAERTARDFPGDPESGILDPERTEDADDHFFAVTADTACPMLELPSGRCRVYAFRPITCRTYGLAWKRDGDVLHPACLLNFADLPGERQTATGIDLEDVDQGVELITGFAGEAGIPSGAETTLVHVVTALNRRFAPHSPAGGRRARNQNE